MIDIDSFIDYFLINEFTLNYDAGWLSTYIYKDIDGKFKMCIWDFNSACDNYQDTYLKPNSLQFQYNVWYVMLMKDEKFTEKIIDRYYELRKTYLSEDYLNTYIDKTTEYLGDAVQRNFEKWGYSFEEGYDLLYPSDRNPRSYEEAKTLLKSVIIYRGNWLDENIHTLRQYSAESKVKRISQTTAFPSSLYTVNVFSLALIILISPLYYSLSSHSAFAPGSALTYLHTASASSEFSKKSMIGSLEVSCLSAAVSYMC
jgi:hypothetical protein